jgi:RNA polymerase sigma-70 factor, ECF subfamily
VRDDGGRAQRSESSVVERAQHGDRLALNALFRRELPPLRRWAQARVPRMLWRRLDVDDFVQLTFIRALRRHTEFQVRHSASFQSYLRKILVNLVRDELRLVGRLPDISAELGDIAAPFAPNALDLLLGKEAQRRYRLAIRTLRPRMRAAVVARLEKGLSYDDIAVRLGLVTPAAARAMVGRGVERVTAEMRRLKPRAQASARLRRR